MNTKYTYRAFGLNFSSDFKIPELKKATQGDDVKISLGETPENIDNMVKRGVRYQVGKDEFLLEIDEIAKFYVKTGNNIIVNPVKDKVDKEVRLFLLGSAFGALFIQRGLLPIHGSSIKFGEFVSVFSGLSGVGKSSLAAYFVQNDFKILADDISVINDDLLVEPGFPNMKVWQDVLKKLEIPTDKLSKIRSELNKFSLPVHGQFYNHPLPVKNIFIIGTKNSPGFEFEEFTGIKKFNAIKNNTYRYRFVEGLKEQMRHFQIVNKLLSEIKVYRIVRPQSPIMIKEFADYVLKTFNLHD